MWVLLPRIHSWHLLHAVWYGKMRCADSNALHREIRLCALNLGIVVSNELLDYLVWGILKLFISLGDNLLNLLETIHSNVLVSVRLEDLSSNLTAFESLSMDKVTVFASSATLRSMVIPTGHGSKIAWLYQLVHVNHSLLSCHLIYLCHLSFSFLIDFLVLIDGFVC
jgi:hypothetical protein